MSGKALLLLRVEEGGAGCLSLRQQGPDVLLALHSVSPAPCSNQAARWLRFAADEGRVFYGMDLLGHRKQRYYT